AVRQLAGADEPRDGREIEDVRRWVAGARGLPAPELVLRRVDEPVALGNEVRLPVVVGGVTVEQDAPSLVDDVEDAPGERRGGDRAEAEVEAPRGRGQAVERPRHDAGT